MDGSPVASVSPCKSVCIGLLWPGCLYVYVGACRYWRGWGGTGSITVLLYLAQNPLPQLLGSFLSHAGKTEEFYAVGSLPLSPTNIINFVTEMCLELVFGVALR